LVYSSFCSWKKNLQIFFKKKKIEKNSVSGEYDWSVGVAEVASVDNNGLVEAKALGVTEVSIVLLRNKTKS